MRTKLDGDVVMTLAVLLVILVICAIALFKINGLESSYCPPDSHTGTVRSDTVEYVVCVRDGYVPR